MIEIAKTSEGEKTVFRLKGRIDTVSAPELSEALEGIPENTKELVLDMEGVSYMSSAGLRCLLAAYKRLAAAGGEMELAGVKGIVAEVLEMTGFSGFFKTI